MPASSIHRLAIASTIAIAASTRTEVPFSYAWRWRFGAGEDDAGAGPGNAWAAAFAPISNTSKCQLRYPDPHRMTSQDCALACAYNPACLAWVHVSHGCSHANSTAGCVPDATSTSGGMRVAPTPVQTEYAYGAAAFDDGAWPVVDAPHDGLASINGSFSESDGDQYHGYRVRTVLWYRKVRH